MSHVRYSEFNTFPLISKNHQSIRSLNINIFRDCYEDRELPSIEIPNLKHLGFYGSLFHPDEINFLKANVNNLELLKF